MSGSAVTADTDSSTWPRPLSLALRCVVVYALLIGLGWHYAQPLAEMALPLFRSFLELLDSRLLILDFSIGHRGADRKPGPDLLFRLEVTLQQAIVVGKGVWMPRDGTWAASSTTVGHFMQMPLLAFGLLLVWPARRWYELTWRLLIGTALIVCALPCDVPLVLWAHVWEAPLRYYDPQGISPLLAWAAFLTNGGRLFIGLLIPALAIRLSITKKPPRRAAFCSG